MNHIHHLAAAAVLAGIAAGVPAQTLLTPGYRVTIESRCPEGEVACAEVGYRGVSRRSGRAITLEGRTLHGLCADAVTPCRFLGWEFRNGDTVYRVLESGELQVTRGERLLVQQRGQWQP